MLPDSKDVRRPVVGVQQPNTISTEQAPTNTVVHCIPMEMFAVHYGDATGRAHSTVFVRMNGAWYEAPNSESWAGSLRHVASKFAKQLDQHVAVQNDKSIPKSDSVDPLDE